MIGTPGPTGAAKARSEEASREAFESLLGAWLQFYFGHTDAILRVAVDAESCQGYCFPGVVPPKAVSVGVPPQERQVALRPWADGPEGIIQSMLSTFLKAVCKKIQLPLTSLPLAAFLTKAVPCQTLPWLLKALLCSL